MALKDFAPEWARQELEELSRAPLAAGILLILGSVAGWFLAGMFYGERMDMLEQAVALLQGGATVTVSPRWQWSAPKVVGIMAAFVLACGGLAWFSRRQYQTRLSEPRQLGPASEVIYGRYYENETVEIDGKVFVECTFKNVRWRFIGNARADFKNVHPFGANWLETVSPAISFYMGMVEDLKLSDFVEHVDHVMINQDGSHKRVSRTVKAAKNLTPEASAPSLAVREARYGFGPDRAHWRDVTEEVRAKISKNALQLLVVNEVLNCAGQRDPYKGQRKVLEVEYSLGGVPQQTAIAEEKTTLLLPPKL